MKPFDASPGSKLLQILEASETATMQTPTAAIIDALGNLTAESVWKEMASLYRSALLHGIEDVDYHTPELHAVHTVDIAKAVGVTTDKVRAALKRLAKAGRVVQVGHGGGNVRWALQG